MSIASPQRAVAQPTSEEFAFTGDSQTFTVPDNVCVVTVEAYGAQGGSVINPVTNAGVGGNGAAVTNAALIVSPGEVLDVRVGGPGGTASEVTGTFGLGGFNGGGDGGENTEFHAGGGGGGASSVLRGTDLLVIAAGGGGGAHGGDGGDGGEVGDPGDKQGTSDSQPGGGATDTTGGDGGDGDSPAGNGAAGTPGQGGAGGPGGDGGGGGGGGFFGGGGAGGGPGTLAGGGAGGGGGSSFGPSGSTFTSGVRMGPGLVEISWDEPCATLEKSASPDVVPDAGADVTFTVAITNHTDDDLTLNSLVDDQFGDLDGVGDCEVPQTIAAGAAYTCTFTEFLDGDAGTAHENTVTAILLDPAQTPIELEDDATVTFVALPTLTKTADPTSVPETGDDVEFTVTIDNDTGQTFELTSLVDDQFGDLDGQGDCAVPQPIAAGGSYSCSFTEALSGEAGTSHVNIVTATVDDPTGTPWEIDDDATVDFAPVPSLTKTANPTAVPVDGANVAFTITIQNDTAEAFELISLVDSEFDLDDCEVPATIAAGATYMCTFTEFFSGEPDEPHVNTVDAVLQDSNEREVPLDDDATVTFADVPTLTKTADPTLVPEAGGEVTFTVTVQNDTDEEFELTSLVDDQFGDLDGQGDCAVPQTILAGDSYACSFTVFMSGEAGAPHVNVVTAIMVDENENSFTLEDDATVEFDPPPPEEPTTPPVDPIFPTPSPRPEATPDPTAGDPGIPGVQPPSSPGAPPSSGAGDDGDVAGEGDAPAPAATGHGPSGGAGTPGAALAALIALLALAGSGAALFARLRAVAR